MALAVTIGMLMITGAPAASAHNRGLIWLPTGECVQVGSLKSVLLGPDKTTQLDLIPEDAPDQVGTSFVAAAELGHAPLELGDCP